LSKLAIKKDTICTFYLASSFLLLRISEVSW